MKSSRLPFFASLLAIAPLVACSGDVNDPAEGADDVQSAQKPEVAKPATPPQVTPVLTPQGGAGKKN